jgi:hypothetical protein
VITDLRYVKNAGSYRPCIVNSDRCGNHQHAHKNGVVRDGECFERIHILTLILNQSHDADVSRCCSWNRCGARSWTWLTVWRIGSLRCKLETEDAGESIVSDYVSKVWAGIMEWKRARFGSERPELISEKWVGGIRGSLTCVCDWWAGKDDGWVFVGWQGMECQ